MTLSIRRVRLKKYGGYSYWRAEIWSPAEGQYREVNNLFPKRHKFALDPESAPANRRDAWQRVFDGKMPTRTQAVLRAEELAEEFKARVRPEEFTIARLVELEQQPMGKRRARAPRTLSDIKRVTNRFRDFMARKFPTVVLACDVRPAHIDEYLRDREAADASEATRTKELAYIRHAFNRAVDLEEIERNPCAKIRLRLPNAKERMERTRGYSRSEFEIRALLKACREEFTDPQGHKRKPPAYLYPLVLCAAQTGARIGELIETVERDPNDRKKQEFLPGLLWKNVDWKHNRMFVTGKTDGRWIVLTPDVRDELRAFAAHQTRLGVLDEQVFQNDAGEPVRYPRAAFKAACKRAKLRGNVRLHDLRHSCFTNLAARGVSPATIQLLAGHSTPTMTAQYVHIAESQMVDELLEKAPLLGSDSGSEDPSELAERLGGGRARSSGADS